MCKKPLFLVSLVLLLCHINTASALWFSWDDGGADHRWTTPENWNPDSVPTIDDGVNIRSVPGPSGPVVDATCGTVEVDHTFIADGSIVTVTGGTLRAGVTSYIMLGSDKGATGILDVNGGNVETLMMCIGNGGPGLLKMQSGILRTDNLEMRYGTKEGTVDVTEGMIIDFGNELDKFNQYIQEGKLIAYGGAPKAFIILEYNEVADETTITAGIYSLALAWNPKPTDNTKNVPYRPTLTWSPGDYAVAHDVYFGTSWDDVNDTDTSDLTGIYRGRQDPNSYTPPEALELGEIYYWRIDEINESNPDSPWKGDVWKFTVVDHLVVDDFESYGDAFTPGLPPSCGCKIYYTWKDGEGWTKPAPTRLGNGTGCVVDLSTDTVHEGGQSLICYYDNDGTNVFGTSVKEYYSETAADTADLAIGHDWTQAGVKVLSLYFYGDADNDANATEQMYVKLNGVKMVYNGDMNDIRDPWWHEWNIELADFGVNLQNITQICIGFGDHNNTVPGGSGVVYFDDIRLYPCRPGWSRSDLNNDCVIDSKDLAIMVDDWLSEILWP